MAEEPTDWEVKALEAECEALKEQMKEAEKEHNFQIETLGKYIPLYQEEKTRAEFAEARLAEVEKILDHKYFGDRLNPDGRGLWRKPDFTSYDYENGDAKDTVDRIAKALRKDKETEE